MIENDILSIFEEIIPVFGDEWQVDSVVVEDELSSFLSQCLGQPADGFIVILEHGQIGELPRFIDWLKRAHCVVLAPSLK